MLRKLGIFTIAFLLSGHLFAQYSLYEDGLENYQNQNYVKAIDLFSQYFTRTMRDKKIDLEVYYFRSLSYYKTEQYKEALDDFNQCIALGHANKGNIHWFMAKCHKKLSQPESAIQEYTNSINILTDKAAQVKLHFERGEMYKTLNNPGAAYDDYVLASNLNPDDQSIKQELEKVGKQTRGTSSNPPPVVATETKKDASKDLKKEDAKKTNEIDKGVQTVLAGASIDPNSKSKARKEKSEEKIPDKSNGVTPPVATPTTEQSSLAAMYADEKRYALVIGNSSYPKDIGALRNPVNDATDLAAELKKSNFEVVLMTNVTYVQMREGMRKFNEKLSNGPKDQTVGLFYYAGHGVQHDDENYLVPVDAKVEFEDDIPRMCFPVQRMVLANMERSSSRMSIVILDACRNNPFPAATRSLGQAGLGEMKRGRGSFIAYATAPGSVASDGTGRNGLYTQELLKAMKQPGYTIEQVFKEVRRNVLKLSGDRQNTWDSSNIVGDFYFKF